MRGGFPTGHPVRYYSSAYICCAKQDTGWSAPVHASPAICAQTKIHYCPRVRVVGAAPYGLLE
eukprot:10732267-Karenia_brevis.AAC.1